MCVVSCNAQLEYINGELWANIWQTECIARINVSSGVVTHWMLFHGLREEVLQRSSTNRHVMDVLNGEHEAFGSVCRACWTWMRVKCGVEKLF